MLRSTLQLSQRLRWGLASRWRNVYFRGLGVKFMGYVWLRDIEIPRNWGDITLGANVALDRGVVLLCSGQVTGGKLNIGAGTYVNRYTMFDAHQHVSIGRDCMIGPNCYLTDGNHGFEAKLPIKSQPMNAKPLILDDDVWLGAGVTILSGVHVGTGAVVGAGSVVTSNIPPNSIVAGVPARVLRFRT